MSEVSRVIIDSQGNNPGYQQVLETFNPNDVVLFGEVNGPAIHLDGDQLGLAIGGVLGILQRTHLADKANRDLNLGLNEGIEALSPTLINLAIAFAAYASSAKNE